MKSKFLKSFIENYAVLDKEGSISDIEGGDSFWSQTPEELDKIGESWLITEFEFNEDWTTWEMHPNGEEIVYLLSGSMDLILDKDGQQQTIELRKKGLVIIERETWHTAKVFEPSKMFVITFGKDTQVKPVK